MSTQVLPQKKIQLSKAQLPIVIVGMGPGGMAAALQIAEKGKAVTILENRDMFTRVQKISLNADTIEFLTQLQEKVKALGIKDDVGDKFIESIPKGKRRVEIAELQEYLENKMKQLYPNLITIKKSEKIQITQINLDKDQPRIIYKNNEIVNELKFSHFIAADGARRGMAKMVVEQNKLPITFKDLDIQLRHEVHGTVNLDILNKEATPGIVKSALDNTDLPALRKHGWNKPYLPKMYVWPNVEGNKFYIAGEMPPIFMKYKGKILQNAEEAWGKTILQLLYQYKPKDVGLNLYYGQDPKQQAMNKLKTTIFPVVLQYVEKNTYDFGAAKGDHTFIQIGDAARNANFYLAHGTNDAIADGIEVAKSLNVNDVMDVEALNEYHQRKKNDIVTEMENARFYADDSEMEDMGKYEIHYLAELKTLSQDAKKIVMDVIKPSDPKYKDLMDNFNKIDTLLKDINKDTRFDEIYKMTMEIFDYVQAQLLIKHHALLMEDLTAHKAKLDSDKFLENVSKWHSKLGTPNQNAEKLLDVEKDKDVKKIFDKKKQLETKPALDKASYIMHQFSDTAKYLKESATLKAKLAAEKVKREEEQDKLDKEFMKQFEEHTASEETKITNEYKPSETNKSQVTELVEKYESLKKNDNMDKNKPSESISIPNNSKSPHKKK